jgi:hypothetical protein
MGADLEAEIRCSLSNQAERSADVDLHYNVERLVRRRMDHFVERESSYCHFSPLRVYTWDLVARTVVYNVVNLAIFSG